MGIFQRTTGWQYPGSVMIELTRCNLCGSNKHSVLYKTYSGDITLERESYKITDHTVSGPIRIVRCNSCGLIYANPHPTAQKLINAYINMVDKSYLEEEAGRRLSARSILKILYKLKIHGRLLDIGSATGFFLDEARKNDWEVNGVELSDWAIDYAKSRLCINNIFHGILKDVHYPDNYFDAIILKDVIEHIADPKDTLIEIRRILKPKGILCINTPDIGSFVSKLLKAQWWRVNQFHLYYFNRKTLYKMLEVSGFKPIKTKSHARTFSIKYWASKFKDYNKKIYSFLVFLIRYNVIANKLLTINLGDQIEIYACKTRKLR